MIYDWVFRAVQMFWPILSFASIFDQEDFPIETPYKKRIAAIALGNWLRCNAHDKFGRTYFHLLRLKILLVLTPIDNFVSCQA